MNLRLLRTGTMSGLLLSSSGAGLVTSEAGGRLITWRPGAWVTGGEILNTG